MTTTASVTLLSPLQQARALALPSRDAMLARAPSVQRFWDDNRQLLGDAWQDPDKELAVADLWQEVSAGVYQVQFFDPARLGELRDYLEQVANAHIPLRPPYGIALNLYGAMLDARSEGYLAAPGFQALYRELMDNYMRPIARLLFPEVMGYDSQTFGFSIQYQPGMDTSLRLHTDASAATLNVNINLPGEEFEGSEVDFYDPATGRVNRLAFAPGMAMLHRGSVAHAAQPITGGKRTNLVMWLYGEGMQIPYHREPYTASNARQRWSVPQAPSDQVAPF